MKTVAFSTLVLIYALNGCISKEIGAKPVHECYWCGPLGDKVNRSQRPAPCEEAYYDYTTCDSSEQYCAIVASFPPYAESRICAKIYQDECYPTYCNTTRSWKMTCPCQGDLCNGIKTEREQDAFDGLIKLASTLPKRDKRDLDSVPQEGEVHDSTDENKIKIDEKKVMKDVTNEKDDAKATKSIVDSEVVVAGAKIVNMADDNNMSTDTKVTTATVTPTTIQAENKKEISEITPTEKTVLEETPKVEKKIVNEMLTESKDSQKLFPLTQIENIQKDALPQKPENMSKDSVKPQTGNVQKDDMLQKPENIAKDAMAPKPEKPENMQNDSPLPQTESMQYDAVVDKSISPKKDAVPENTENMQKDEASPKNDNIPKDSQPTNLDHEKAEKTSPNEKNPIDNNLEKPPVTPLKDSKKHEDPLTTTASNLDKSPNATATHRVHNNEATKHHKSHSTRLQSQFYVFLLVILGNYKYFV